MYTDIELFKTPLVVQICVWGEGILTVKPYTDSESLVVWKMSFVFVWGGTVYRPPDTRADCFNILEESVN